VTDIDKLHNAVELIINKAPRLRRSAEITSAYVELIVGEILLGDYGNTYLYIAETRAIGEQTLSRILKRLSECGITPTQRTYDTAYFGEMNQRLICRSVQQMKSTLCGATFNRVFVDVALAARSEAFQTALMSDLLPLLPDGVGDIL